MMYKIYNFSTGEFLKDVDNRIRTFETKDNAYEVAYIFSQETGDAYTPVTADYEENNIPVL